MLIDKGLCVRCAAAIGAILLVLPVQPSTAQEALPTVEVVATSPLGAETSTLNVPSETQTISG